MRALILMVLLPALALAADKKKPKLDLGLKVDVGGSIPKGENLATPTEKPQRVQSSQTPSEATWAVVRVQHGRAFLRGPNGAVATAPLDAIPGGGNPFTSEKFTTVVRVKCPQRQSAAIELSVLDSRGNSMMEGGGTLYYRGEKNDEADYTLDWDPTPLRGPGEYSLVVRVAGNTVGTFPMKVVEKTAAK